MAEPTQSSIDPVAPLREILQRYTAGAPVTLSTTQSQQGPRRPSTPAVVTPTAAASPAPAQADQSQPSLLASLREAVAQDVAPLSSSERMGAFGRGVLSNRGSFLDNLSAGLAAQGQAEAARRNELRQSIETQARLAEMDRKAALEKAKFAEETSPESLSGRYREAQIANLRAQAAQAGRSNLQIVGTDEATGYVRAMDPRTGETRVLTGVRPTRSELAANAAEERIRGRALSNAARAVDEEMKLNPTLNRENRIRQLFPVYLELARSEERAASGGGGGGGSRLPTAPTESNPPPQRMQYQPPR